jgi:DNA excision repair protein ERCC-3
LPYRAAATAAEKWPVVRALVRRHRSEGVLVIGQYLDQLRDLAARLEAPLIVGTTPRAERERAFDRFRAGAEPVLVLSRVGNAAIDLPNARVGIEVSGNFGSRQEEAQRLGRLLRPKPDGQPAHFYAVIASGTVEGDHAARRQRFLVEQGYEYRIVVSRQTSGSW